MAANLRAVTFSIGEDLGEYESWRLKKQLRLQQARLGDVDLPFAQEIGKEALLSFPSRQHGRGTEA